MRTEYEEYRDTGMLGGYCPERAVLREAENGKIDTFFRDATHRITKEGFTAERGMLIGGRSFYVTSVFLVESNATPTEKLLSLIDADLSKEAHSA